MTGSERETANSNKKTSPRAVLETQRVDRRRLTKPSTGDCSQQLWERPFSNEELFSCDWALSGTPQTEANDFSPGRTRRKFQQAEEDYYSDWS